MQPFADARRLLELLDGRGQRLVLASSGKRDEVDHYLDLLDARDLIEAWTTSADVERTKPDPDLVVTAIGKVGGGEAVMVGDSTFDCQAAARVDVPHRGHPHRRLLLPGAAPGGGRVGVRVPRRVVRAARPDPACLGLRPRVEG